VLFVGFLGLWTFEGFFFFFGEGFGSLDTCFEDVCVWFKTLAARSVSGRRSNKQNGGGFFCSETQKTQCFKLGFYQGIWFRVLYILFLKFISSKALEAFEF
jgi:hypothetical protein